MCLVPAEARRGCGLPGTVVKDVVSHQGMLGTEPGPLQDQQAVSSAPMCIFFFKENTFKTGLKGDFWSLQRKHKDSI